MEPTIYLFFKGNCLDATTHYVETLGGEIWGTLLNGDATDLESRMLSGDDMVLNMAMSIDNATVMASDNSDEICDKP